MKAETKLKKLLAMEDSVKKRTKLFEFICHVMPQSQIWYTAVNEYNRLKEATING